MKKLLLSSVLFGATTLTLMGADTAFLFKVSDNGKPLGYYEVNFKNNGKIIETKSHGMADKIEFFVDKKIVEKGAGAREIVFQKNNEIESFKVYNKMSSIDKATKEEFDRKLQKVDHDDMLLVLKKGSENIELFNKRKTILFTFEEVLEQVSAGRVTEDILLFDQMGVMKMIAEVDKTTKGYDIINKSKDSKYIGIETKKGLPLRVKSYVSDWSLELIGAGELKKYEADNTKLLAIIKENVENQIKNTPSLSFVDVVSMTQKSQNLQVGATIKVAYGEALSKSDGKRACNQGFKEVFKKGSKIVYNDDHCLVQVDTQLSAKDTVKPIIDDLVGKYEQLKFTKNYDLTSKGITYKLIDEIK